MKTILLFCSLCCSFIAVGQNVGIGTAVPAEKLDVNGNVKATNVIATNSFQLINGAAVGKVLTSNAAGVGSWVSPAAVSGGTISSTVSLGAFAGSSLPLVGGLWEFFGPSTNIVLNGNQRVVMNMVAGLGKSTSGTDFFTLDIGYQLQPGGAIIRANGANFIEYIPVFPAGGSRIPYNMPASFKPVAGTYKIGCIISGNTVGFLDNNDYVNGYYMVINE